MKHRTSLLGAFGALLAFAAPARAETIDPVSFSRTISFKAAGYDGASTLERFPVLVRLSEGIAGFSYADIGGTTNAAYASLRFTDADRASLDYEIEAWNPGGTSFVWVSLPELSGTNTEFHAFYAPVPSAVLPAVHPTNVWTSAGYVGVWHMNNRVKIDGTWGYVDSSGGNENLFGQSDGDVAEPRTDTSYNANGTPWATGGRTRTKRTSGWTFSQTGYSVESWISTRDLPGYNNGTARNGYMFASDAKTDNGAEVQWRPSNGLQFYPTYITILGGSVNPTHVISNNQCWPGDATNDWHFISAVWPQEGSAELSTLYEAGAGYSNDGTNLRILKTINRRAIDFTGERGMGVLGSSDLQGNGCYYDEARVRRGLSTPDWIQANWDTQRIGTDFVEYGDAVGDPRAPIVSAVAGTSATAVLEFSLADHGGATAKALFVAFPSFETNAVAVANLTRPSARATGLSPDTDYTVTFVVENGGAVVYETPSTAFTTAGRPTLRPNAYRHSVTFTASGYDGAETLEHFPVLVRLSEAAIPGFSYAGTDPAEIRFTTADGALLAHEVETWDPAGLSAIWVALPELSGRDTSFTMHWSPYDGAGVPAQPVFRVWEYAGYVGVWHLSSIVKNQSEAYQAYNAPLWGHVFPDSAGCGANATKGTTTWNTSLQNAPGERFSESLGRANGTLGANAYTPFLVPPTAEGGGAGDWRFSMTGYSTEAWVFPSKQQHNILVSGNSASATSDGFIFAATNGVRLCAGDWGGSTVPWSPDNANESFWHFVAAVWTPSTSSDPSVLYGTSGDGAPTKLVERSGKHATDQCATDGMLLVGGSGVDFGLDEIRVRRGLSTPDWIQANWDTQRLGTDFLAAGPVVDNLLPTVIVVR